MNYNQIMYVSEEEKLRGLKAKMQGRLFRRRKANVKEICRITFGCVIPAMILAWLVLSWANVVCNNLSTCEYAWWNAFRIFELR